MGKRINRQVAARVIEIKDSHCSVRFHYADEGTPQEKGGPGMRCTTQIHSAQPGDGPVVAPRTVVVTKQPPTAAVLALSAGELQMAARLYVEKSLDKAIAEDPNVTEVTEAEQAPEAEEEVV
jgi:hypothetical protein